MSGWKSLAIACAYLVVAGGAEAQTSLFEPPASSSGAAPLTPPAEGGAPAAKPKPRAKPRGPVPARALSITNDSANAVTGLEVSGDGKSAKLAKELPTGKTATLKLPALKSCTVAISVTFQGGAAPDTHEQDICKDRRVRLTN
jgi:hypothetical protein